MDRHLSQFHGLAIVTSVIKNVRADFCCMLAIHASIPLGLNPGMLCNILCSSLFSILREPHTDLHSD